MVVEVCVAVVARGGKFLVRRRPRGAHLAGAWEFPGGKRRPGERGRACAERECREETGLGVAAGREIARVRHDYPGRKVDLRFFACEVRGGRLRRTRSLRWVPPAALLRMEIPEANRGVVRGLARGPARGLSRGPSRGPSRGLSRGPSQGLSPSAAKPRKGAVPGSDSRST